MPGIIGLVYLNGFSPSDFFRNRVAPSFGRFIRWLGSFFAHAQTREEQNFNLTRECLSEVRDLVDKGSVLSDLEKEAKALPDQFLEGKNRSYRLQTADLPEGSLLKGVLVEAVYVMRAKPEGSLICALTEGEMLNLRDYLLGGETAPDGSAVWGRQEDSGLLSQFVADCHRQCVGHDTFAIDKATFSSNDIETKKLYAASSEEKTYEQFLAEHVASVIKAATEKSPHWYEILQAVLTQGVDRYITRLDSLTEALGSKGMLVTGDGLPRHKKIQLKHGALGEVIGASVEVKICYQVSDPSRTIGSSATPVAFVDVTAAFDLSFTEGSLEVENGEFDVQVLSPPDLAIQEMRSVSEGYRKPGASLVDSVGRTLLWGMNGLVGNTFERWRLSQSVSEFSAFIDGKGAQTPDEIREQLRRLRELYQKTGLDVYRVLIIKMGRALTTRLSMDCTDKEIQACLEETWAQQIEPTNVNEDGDLSMYVRDNSTRSIANVRIQFPEEEGVRMRSQTFSSDSEYYNRDDVGSERRFFQTLKREFDRYTDERLPVRQMAQVLMTQATLLSPIHTIMVEALPQSNHALVDIPEKTHLDITIRGDGSIIFVSKNSFKVQDRDLRDEDIGTLDVGVRGEARFVDGKWQVHNIRHKFDLS